MREHRGRESDHCGRYQRNEVGPWQGRWRGGGLQAVPGPPPLPPKKAPAVPKKVKKEERYTYGTGTSFLALHSKQTIFWAERE
jgi:hypothetical protein